MKMSFVRIHVIIGIQIYSVYVIPLGRFVMTVKASLKGFFSFKGKIESRIT